MAQGRFRFKVPAVVTVVVLGLMLSACGTPRTPPPIGSGGDQVATAPGASGGHKHLR
jgi:hypothetical protein